MSWRGVHETRACAAAYSSAPSIRWTVELPRSRWMIRVKHVWSGLVAVVLSLPAVSASAQVVADTPATYEPVSGQEGKDVVWVPTPQGTVDAMLDLAKVTPADIVMDLGSGNGITVITAARRGATAVGVEFNPDMVALSRQLAQEAGVSAKATFVQGDLFEADLSKATVITMFLLPTINEQLRPKLLDLKPGTRIVTNTFEMGDWEPDARATAEPCTSWCTALLWIVPAKVDGAWQVGSQALRLTQQYQEVSGTLGDAPIVGGKLQGDTISFTVGGKSYTGRVNGDRITGEGWAATRSR
jgi:SAM-dependent methyltransferase